MEVYPGTGKACKLPTESAQLNMGPSECEATVLTTLPLYHPIYLIIILLHLFQFIA